MSVVSSGDYNSVQRRSQRVMLKALVLVVTQGADNRVVSEVTRTVTVNAHGAMLLLELRVSVGQLLTLRHLNTGEEVSCRVVYVGPQQSDKKEVGVDFVKSCPGFWRISFPPEDWTIRSPEAKGSASRGNPIPAPPKEKK